MTDKKSATAQVRIKPEVRQKLKVLAAKWKMTISDVIESLLTRKEQ